LIVRISRAKIRRDQEAPAFEILRAAAASGIRPAGLEAMFISRRMGDIGNELVAVTVWRDLDALIAGIGPQWAQPAFLPSLDAMLNDGSVEHFETIAEDYEGILELVG
jgi:hypothetical protein